MDSVTDFHLHRYRRAGGNSFYETRASLVYPFSSIERSAKLRSLHGMGIFRWQRALLLRRQSQGESLVSKTKVKLNKLIIFSFSDISSIFTLANSLMLASQIRERSLPVVQTVRFPFGPLLQPLNRLICNQPGHCLATEPRLPCSLFHALSARYSPHPVTDSLCYGILTDTVSCGHCLLMERSM